ncbi:sigma-70 family RNA polymerase sigma factor [Planctomonas deserti]|uniref:sigma-70 family RNA polymerase sigma factor n=1 Tax=Planctomonas deserti TaxID=2144185 RepID=UPI000D34E280|nr:sigma-70 family RNA polymerase sigma factor [Planctomonas deserti]
MPEPLLDDAGVLAAASSAEPDVARVIRLEPDPSVLGAIGRSHSLGSAIADLVDNSIDAGAERIGIRFLVRNAEVVGLRISDDGTGMTESQLMDAMTLGKRRAYGAGALGHFGLGLKAASMSQANTLQVYTNAGFAPVAGARMLRNDIGGDFSIDVLTESAAWAGFHAKTYRGLDSTGTVVEWSGLDGVSHAAQPSARRDWLDKVISALRGELGLTFHRLIAGSRLRIEIEEFDLDFDEAGAPRVVSPIDPFDFHASGRNGYPARIDAELADGTPVAAACYIMPPGATGSTARMLGRSRAEWQGMYIYRNDRLLQSGGWLGLLEDHGSETQLARVAIDLPDGAQRSIVINPEKRGVVLRADFVQALETAVSLEGVNFRQFVTDAAETLRTSNARKVGPKPVTDLDTGLTPVLRDALREGLGVRESVAPASIRWCVLDDERLFKFDHASRTLWMNAGYRRALTAADALSLSLYLLVERHFSTDRPQQQTLDQIEAWQGVVALATISALPSGSFDPLTPADESNASRQTRPTTAPDLARVASVPQQLDFAEFDDPWIGGGGLQSPAPSPLDLARTLEARHRREVPHALELPLEVLPAEELPVIRPQAQETITDAGERTEQLGHVRLTDDVISDLRARLDRYPLLTADEEVALARAIEAGLLAEERLGLLTDTERSSSLGPELRTLVRAGTRARDRFINSNLRLVFSLAGGYRNRGLELADLAQEGFEGLMRAVDKFDFTKGFKFSTYATWWIRQAISRACADRGNLIRIPVHMHEQHSKILGARSRLIAESDAEPTAGDIARATGMSVDDVDSALGYVYTTISLDQVVGVQDGDVTVGDLLVDVRSIEPIELVEAADIAARIDQLVEELPDRQSEVLRLRFGLGGAAPNTLDQIGDRFDVTRERIRQIEKKALTSLGDLDTGGLRASTAVSLFADFCELDLEKLTIGALGRFSPKPREPVGTVVAASTEDRPVVPSRGQSRQVEAVEVALGSDADLVARYRAGATIAVIGLATGSMEEREIVRRLAEHLFGPEATNDDSSLAPRHGLPWSPDERERVHVAFRSGTKVTEIAEANGRTPFAVAWQLLDSPRRPVQVPKRLLRDLRRSAAGRARRGPDSSR